jgi:hypothetical protein
VVDIHHGVQEGGVDLVRCAFVLEMVVVGGGSWEEELAGGGQDRVEGVVVRQGRTTSATRSKATPL